LKGGVLMLPNLNAELARSGITKKELAIRMQKRYATLLGKLNGKYPLTYDECKQIKFCIHSDLPIETLFFTK
jgi:hypothetical protein